ncbi:hypothetical protein GCM10023219_08580 [Stakelama sediminis]|uniref:Phage shock protein PspC (Stress-responsive transcriptional regulator) n=1 Tax=Stakelama sediminis TaxID=463200 RepID=A0A840YV67_9SPHN|nr:phage shock protein PspC (stress-responsive transcriptional regulator) [Stakelama sediminis]
MTDANDKLFNRPDTFFGVCEGLGRDFGFHPNILRVIFAVGLLWNPEIVIATYIVLGIAVHVSRWLAPVPKTSSSPAEETATVPAMPVEEERLAA